MSKFIIANWKMNFSLDQSIEFCSKISDVAKECRLIIAPPIPYLSYLASNFKDIKFCAQNVSWLDLDGPYTGEYSASILKSCGIDYCLIGHSERRTLFSDDTEELISKKVNNVIAAHMIPIVCIGESAEARNSNNYKQSIKSQLEFIKGIEGNIIIAYEPIWSIGSNRILSKSEIDEMIEFINLHVNQKAIANNVSIVYGGSVNLDNIDEILALKNVNGALLGRTSLNYYNLIKILEKSY